MRCKLSKRGDVSSVRALARKREMDPVERTRERGGKCVRNSDHVAGVARHVALRLLVVAEAEVKAELDVGRDNPADPDQSFEDAGLHFREPRGQIASEHPELDIRVPLQRELVVRDLVEDSLDLVCHRRLVCVFHSS